MSERVTFLPPRKMFLTGCPALRLEEKSSAEVLGAELDPRRVTREKGEPDPSNNIVLLVRVIDLVNPKREKISRIVVKSEGRTPQEIFDAIFECRGPKIGRITEFSRCPILTRINAK